MRSRLIPKQALRFQRSLASGHGGPPDSYGPVKSLVPFGGIRKEKNSYPDRIPGDRIHDVPPKLRNYLDSMAEKPAILPRKEKEVHYWTMGRQIFIGENDRTKILALKAQGLAPPETEGAKDLSKLLNCDTGGYYEVERELCADIVNKVKKQMREEFGHEPDNAESSEFPRQI